MSSLADYVNSVVDSKELGDDRLHEIVVEEICGDCKGVNVYAGLYLSRRSFPADLSDAAIAERLEQDYSVDNVVFVTKDELVLVQWQEYMSARTDKLTTAIQWLLDKRPQIAQLREALTVSAG